MQNTFIFVGFVLAFWVFYKLYQIINPFGRKIMDESISTIIRRGDLKQSITGTVVFFILVSMLLFIYIWTKVFFRVYLINRKDFGEYIYYFYPQQVIFGLPALFMGIMTSVICVDFLIRIFFKKYYFEICDYLKIYGGLSTQRTRILDVAFAVASIGIIVHLAFFTNCYAVFKNDVIVANSLVSFKEKTYNYSQIEKILVSTHDRTSSGKEYEKYLVILVFDDGKEIATNDFGYRFLKNDIQDFIDFVSDKSEKEPIVKRYVKDLKSLK